MEEVFAFLLFLIISWIWCSRCTWTCL